MAQLFVTVNLATHRCERHWFVGWFCRPSISWSPSVQAPSPAGSLVLCVAAFHSSRGEREWQRCRNPEPKCCSYLSRTSDFDLHGCVALTGTDAGNVPSRPFSSRSCISLSALMASFGSSACTSRRVGSNFSAIVISLFMSRVNVLVIMTFRRPGSGRAPSDSRLR